MMDLDSELPTVDLFRPSKKKKVYRKRIDAEAGVDSVDVPNPTSTTKTLPPPEPAISDEPMAESSSNPPLLTPQASPSIQDILRQRKAAQRRKAGIEFSNTSTNLIGDLSASAALIQPAKEAGEDGVASDIERLVSRFAPQTGHVAEANDKHMMDYVDSELARLHQSQRQRQPNPHDPYNDPTTLVFDTPLPTNPALPEGRQPAALGRIHEIDLGPANKARTVALTEAARQRLQLLREGADPEALDAAESQKPPRLRRDGKPFRRRKRRNSSDIKRDKLVEEVLRESRLDIYDDDQQNGTGSNKKPHRARKHNHQQHPLQGSNNNEPTARSPPPCSHSSGSGSESGSDDEEAADDALAEQFRRDFLEQVAARRRQRQRGPPPGSAKARAAQQEKQRRKLDGAASSRGPKLGGSRSARAKVRERQLEEKAAAKRGGR